MNESSLTAILVALLAGGTLGSLISGLFNRKKNDAGTYEQLSNTITNVQTSLDKETIRNSSLREKLDEQEEKFNKELEEQRQELLENINELKYAYEAKIKEFEARIASLEAEKRALIIENHMLRTEIQKGDQTE